MTLDQYLELKGMTAAAFGAKCNPPISEASISRIRKGTQNISRDTMLSIIAASDGLITAEGLVRPPSFDGTGDDPASAEDAAVVSARAA